MWITNLLGLVLCGAEDTLLRSGSPSDTDGERGVGFALPRVIFGGGELLPGRVLGAPLWSEGWGVPEGTSVSCASAKVQSFLHIIPCPLSNPLCIGHSERAATFIPRAPLRSRYERPHALGKNASALSVRAYMRSYREPFRTH